MSIDSIIFDLDGTLWDSSKTILESWNSVLSGMKEIKRPITMEELTAVMGLQLPEIGKKFFPYLDEDKQIEVTRHCCTIECDWIRKKGGVLYPGLEENLKTLSEKLPLFIVSNCQEGYIEGFLEYHKLLSYFKDFEFAGDKGFSKGENIKKIMQRNNLKSPIYVGDTMGDLNGARLANIPFVYASYGFGHVETYDYIIKEFRDLTTLVFHQKK